MLRNLFDLVKKYNYEITMNRFLKKDLQKISIESIKNSKIDESVEDNWKEYYLVLENHYINILKYDDDSCDYWITKKTDGSLVMDSDDRKIISKRNYFLLEDILDAVCEKTGLDILV